jgi:solute carrier family 35 protein E3
MDPQVFKMFLALLLNVVSSVGVIFINKQLVFVSAHFTFGTALTIVHFVVTFAGCVAFAYGGFFEPKKMDILRVLPISLAFCGYVAFNNMSLLTNSVSVYQISKIMCTPLIVAVEMFQYEKHQSRETLVALLPVCVGIFVTVFADAHLSVIGTFWAVLAIISNSFYTIWGKTKQSELNASPMQLLIYQAPISAVILCFMLPWMESLSALRHFTFTPHAVFCIGLSCVFAFGVNFSFFLFVGQTSPLTMNVVGYLKTVLVFVGGWVFFDSDPTWQSAFGIFMTLVGLAMYSKAKLAPAPAPKEDESQTV